MNHSAILNVHLAIVLFVCLSVIASAAEVTVQTGNIMAEKNNELFLSLKNTEVGGHDYRLVSAGYLGGIGVGKFGIYDATAGLTRLTIDAVGNVGIGTTVPGTLLDVRKSLAGVRIGTIYNQDTAAGASGLMVIVGSNTATDFGLHVRGNDGGTDVLWAGASGSVGIGTTSPKAGLDVRVPRALFGSTALSNDPFVFSPTDAVVILGQDPAHINRANLAIYTTTAATDDGGSITLGAIDNTFDRYVPQAKIKSGVVSIGVTNKGYLSFHTINANVIERMRINEDGNVGIGTTTPKAKLDVAGEVKLGNTGAACNADTAGAVRYNSGSKIMEFCDGAAWKAI